MQSCQHARPSPSPLSLRGTPGRGEHAGGAEGRERLSRIIVTGFRAFPGVPDNPSQIVVEALSRDPVLLPPPAECHLLDTAYDSVGPALGALLATAPGALLLTGFSATARGFRLERRAGGACALDIADAEGAGPPACLGAGTDDLAERCDVPALADALRVHGFPVEISDDAGRYVCNHAYCFALSRIAAGELPTQAIFVHLPAIEGTALAVTSASAIPLQWMTRGIALIARVMLAEAGATLSRP